MEVARSWPRQPMTDVPAEARILASVDGELSIRGRLDGDRATEMRCLFEAERDGLFRFLWRLTGNANDAEDLLQETFLTAWRKQDKFQVRAGVTGYLRSTALHLFLNARSKRERRAALTPRETDAEVESASHCAAENEARESLRLRVRAAIAALPEGTREVFVLFRFEGMSCAEIARSCDLSVTTVEGRIERAMKQLATRLRPHAEDMPEL
jgi:RNA polymerase sigma-70 factor, ECF subfamily